MKLFARCALHAGLAITALAADARLKITDLPAAVQTAMKEQIKGATIIGASKERENGRLEYEVETRVNNKSRDLTFAENGTLLEVEQEVELASIPEAARAAIQKRVGGGKIRKVESVTRGPQVSYEAAVTRNGRHTEVAVNADGTPHHED